MNKVFQHGGTCCIYRDESFSLSVHHDENNWRIL